MIFLSVFSYIYTQSEASQTVNDEKLEIGEDIRRKIDDIDDRNNYANVKIFVIFMICKTINVFFSKMFHFYTKKLCFSNHKKNYFHSKWHQQ